MCVGGTTQRLSSVCGGHVMQSETGWCVNVIRTSCKPHTLHLCTQEVGVRWRWRCKNMEVCGGGVRMWRCEGMEVGVSFNKIDNTI